MRRATVLFALLISFGVFSAPRFLVTRGNPISGNISSGSTVFGSSGTLSGTTYTGPANWFAPTTSAIGSNYWLKIVKSSCSGATSISGITDSTWTQISASITLAAAGGAGSCSGTWAVSPSSTGTVTVGSGSISVNNTI
jgi:hypothetical protein